MTDKRPRFAIMGSGGVGAYFGACLVRAGIETWFVARGAHLQAMRTVGLKIEEADGSVETYPVNATDDPAEIGTVDFVLFCVKLWDTAEAGAVCRPLLGAQTAVVSLQNGVNSEDELAELLGPDHVMGGVAEIFATIKAPGVIKRVSPFARIRFGELDGSHSPRSQQLANALAVPGIEVDHHADIKVALWNKFLLLIGVSATTALTRQPLGAIRGDPDPRDLLEQVMVEVLAVAQAMGIPLAHGIVAERMAFIDTLPADMRASMAHDLAHGRRLELPWLSGAVVERGRKLGVPTPANSFVFAALKLSASAPA
ncbi:MAG: 2-dehydropantoate 2-reductase [Alphaproteobacteria bacterium]